MKLNARQVETAKPKDKPYKMADGGGLYLLVKTNGSRYWRLKYRIDGKEKLLALGGYGRVMKGIRLFHPGVSTTRRLPAEVALLAIYWFTLTSIGLFTMLFIK
nr:Arm DNA-binding domain-containing protein [Pectobacterium versatile]